MHQYYLLERKTGVEVRLAKLRVDKGKIEMDAPVSVIKSILILFMSAASLNWGTPVATKIVFLFSFPEPDRISDAGRDCGNTWQSFLSGYWHQVRQHLVLLP